MTGVIRQLQRVELGIREVRDKVALTVPMDAVSAAQRGSNVGNSAKGMY